MKNSVFYYSVGPLLYCPANHTGIADSLIQERFGTHFSLAMCLEDTIADGHVEEAERQLTCTLKNLPWRLQKNPFLYPKFLSEYEIRNRSSGFLPVSGMLPGF